MMRPITTLCCLLWLACDADACGFDSFNELNKILGSCCESTSLGNAKASRDCSQGFPNTCTLACANLLVPFYADCHTMMSAMPASNFKFKLKELDLYVQHCQHTRELLQYSDSTTTCAANAKAKEQRVLDVSAACCSHKGKFTCKNSVPWSCNAQCGVKYVPFFEECLRRDAVLNVPQLHQYAALYESCANMDNKDVGIMLNELNTLLSNPKCRVNTSSVRTRGGIFKLSRKKVSSCVDDDKTLMRMYPGTTCVKAAASGAGCKMSHVQAICQCSCRGHQVQCHDNDDGLRELYGAKSGTCLSAASSNMGCTMYGVANMCQCSCAQRNLHDHAAQGGHRRRAQVSHVSFLPGASHNHVTSTTCKWDTFDDRLGDIDKVCCPRGCKGTVPSACSFECGRKFASFMTSCGALFHDLIVNTRESSMTPYTKFLAKCQQLDPRSLARAVQHTRCATCGNGQLENWAGEECDSGKTASDTCTPTCRIVCPKLKPPAGMTISYTNSDVFLHGIGNKAKYTCSNTHKPPHGNAVRTCQNNGRWTGTVPLSC